MTEQERIRAYGLRALAFRVCFSIAAIRIHPGKRACPSCGWVNAPGWKEYHDPDYCRLAA
jgi:hypothetical protein